MIVSAIYTWNAELILVEWAGLQSIYRMFEFSIFKSSRLRNLKPFE
jgi:hypothetical protein